MYESVLVLVQVLVDFNLIVWFCFSCSYNDIATVEELAAETVQDTSL